MLASFAQRPSALRYTEEDSEDFFFQQDGKEAFFNIKPSCQQIEENVGDYDENGHFVEAEEIWNHKQVEVEEDAHQQQNHEGQEEKSEAEESEAANMMMEAAALTKATVMKAVMKLFLKINEPLKMYLMMKKTSWRIPVRRMEEMCLMMKMTS